MMGWKRLQLLSRQCCLLTLVIAHSATVMEGATVREVRMSDKGGASVLLESPPSAPPPVRETRLLDRITTNQDDDALNAIDHQPPQWASSERGDETPGGSLLGVVEVSTTAPLTSSTKPTNLATTITTTTTTTSESVASSPVATGAAAPASVAIAAAGQTPKPFDTKARHSTSDSNQAPVTAASDTSTNSLRRAQTTWPVTGDVGYRRPAVGHRRPTADAAEEAPPISSGASGDSHNNGWHTGATNNRIGRPPKPGVWEAGEDAGIEHDIVTRILTGAKRNQERMRNRNLRRLMRRFHVLAVRADITADEFHRFMRLVAEYTPSRIPAFLLRKSERRAFEETNRARWEHVREEMLRQARKQQPGRVEVIENFLKVVEHDGAFSRRLGLPRTKARQGLAAGGLLSPEDILRRHGLLRRRILPLSHTETHNIVRGLIDRVRLPIAATL